MIPPTWWKHLQESADLAFGRAKFRTSPFDGYTILMTVIGIEIEAAPIAARWPAKPKPPARPPGKRPSSVWQVIFQYFDNEVARNGRFPNLNSAATAVQAWLKENKKRRAQLHFSTLKRGIKKNRPDWFHRAE